MISGWRIADPEFSKNAAQMMSGEGAFRYGGRWNSKGVRVVYLGSSLAQAAMELLIHLGRAEVLNVYNKMEVTFVDDLAEHISIEDLPKNWAEPSMASSVQVVGDDWIAKESSVILQVPSAAIKGEYNYLLNPSHPLTAQVNFGPITPFNFDPRLIKD